MPVKGMGVQIPPRTPKRVISPQNRQRLNTAAHRPPVTGAGAPMAGRAAPLAEPAAADQVIAPVIPSTAGVARRRPGGPDGPGASPLPLASPPAAARQAAGVVYGMGRVDSSGRVADRSITRVLGWRAGDRLTLTAAAGVVVARRDPCGMVVLPARPYIAIPAALRRRCGLHPGDRVLLAAAPHADTLAAYSFAVVDQALRAHGASLSVEGGQP